MTPVCIDSVAKAELFGCCGTGALEGMQTGAGGVGVWKHGQPCDRFLRHFFLPFYVRWTSENHGHTLVKMYTQSERHTPKYSVGLQTSTFTGTNPGASCIV